MESVEKELKENKDGVYGTSDFNQSIWEPKPSENHVRAAHVRTGQAVPNTNT